MEDLKKNPNKTKTNARSNLGLFSIIYLVYLVFMVDLKKRSLGTNGTVLI